MRPVHLDNTKQEAEIGSIKRRSTDKNRIVLGAVVISVGFRVYGFG